MLAFSKRLIDFEDYSLAAGLYMWGDTGVGKSHMSVGIAKEFMIRGMDARFVNADKTCHSYNLRLGPNQVWVMDDLNSGYSGGASRLFLEVTLNAHNVGGRVFVTSNTPYEKLVDECFVGKGEKKPKYVDRTKNMFKVLQIEGESQRAETAWYR